MIRTPRSLLVAFGLVLVAAFLAQVPVAAPSPATAASLAFTHSLARPVPSGHALAETARPLPRIAGLVLVAVSAALTARFMRV